MLKAKKNYQGDLFILKMVDVPLKDDMASMEHPFFFLSSRVTKSKIIYENNGNTIEISPSFMGFPTVFDKDIWIFALSKLVHLQNQGLEIDKTVHFSAREFFLTTNRDTGGKSYKALEASFHRLRGTNLQTNIKTGKMTETKIFGMIESGGFVTTDDGKRVDHCEITFSDWTMRSIQNKEVLSITEDYFRIRKPLARRIYEIGRKHCGRQPFWKISIKNLQEKVGSRRPIYEFRHQIKEIVGQNVVPEYSLQINDKDQLIFYSKKKKPQEENPLYKDCLELGLKRNEIDHWIEEKGEEYVQEIAEYVKIKQNKIDNISGYFVTCLEKGFGEKSAERKAQEEEEKQRILEKENEKEEEKTYLKSVAEYLFWKENPKELKKENKNLSEMKTSFEAAKNKHAYNNLILKNAEDYFWGKKEISLGKIHSFIEDIYK